jgi:hypothetical protein
MQFLSFFISRMKQTYTQMLSFFRGVNNLLNNAPLTTESLSDVADMNQGCPCRKPEESLKSRGRVSLKWFGGISCTVQYAALVILIFFVIHPVFGNTCTAEINHSSRCWCESRQWVQSRDSIPEAALQQPDLSYAAPLHSYLNCWYSKIYTASKPTVALNIVFWGGEYICANTCEFDQICLLMVCKKF